MVPDTCGLTAASELVELTMTVPDHGVVTTSLPTPTWSPDGELVSDSVAVCGVSWTVEVEVRPPLSVAVSWNSNTLFPAPAQSGAV